ncbi:MAG: SPASM domain-containing protein [Desulfurella sp.]
MLIDDLKLPVSYFKSIEFTMQVGCSVGCNFCPQGVFVKNYRSNIKSFTLESFKKALNNIKNSTIEEIKFSGFSEPLENAYIYDCILEAYKEGFRVELITTLKNFSKAGFETIKNLPIKCHISIQPPNLNNRKGLNDATAWNNVEQLLSLNPKCYLVFGCLDNGLTQSMKNDLKSIENKLNISIKYERYTTRAGYMGSILKTNPHKKLICKHNLGQVALPNGDLALCCMDFGLKHIVGNIFSEHYTDILNSEKLKNIIQIMLGQKEGEILCQTCEYAKAIPGFLSPKCYANARESFKNLRDKLVPKNSSTRKKLDALFR